MEMPRVLHIDYPGAIIRLLENTFHNKGLIWESTESGIQGFHLALLQNYNLILLSLHEPSIDGLRILKGLKRAGVHTPIVILLPSRELEFRREELARYPNVLTCLAKPVDIKHLEKVMEFLRQPPTLPTKDKMALLEILSRVEKAVLDET